MKKFRLFALLICAALIPAVFSACTRDGEPAVSSDETTAAETAEPVLPIELTGENGYRIIVPDESSDEIRQAARDLQRSIRQASDKELEIKSDLIVPAAGFKETPYEILIGHTNREATESVSDGLLYRDYTIAAVGTKIVVCGGGDEATVIAVNRFITDCIKKSTVVEGNLKIDFTGEYAVKELKINGVDISKYTIVYPFKEKAVYNDAITALNEKVRNLTGFVLPIGTAAGTASEYEIQFGDCSRGASSGLKPGSFEYTIAGSDKSVAFVAGSVIGARASVKAFLKDNLPDDAKGSLNIAVTGQASCEVSAEIPMANEASVRVMTANVLGGDTLVSRAPYHISVFTEYLPDVIGLQECNSSGQSSLLNGLGSIYGLACKSIGSGTSNCYTPILYLKDKYELLESGSKLFDKRWTETNTKTFAWVVLKNKETGQISAYINAHWSLILGSYDTVKVFGVKMTNSVEGAEWREDNTREILAKKDELRKKYGEGLPVVAMGDMNANASAKSVYAFSPAMTNAMNISKGMKTTGINSFHSNPGQKPDSGSPIDNLMVTAEVIDVYRHEIVTTDTAILSSDHCQVVIDIAFK